MNIYDTPEKYGIISRALHWAMAALLLWQFLGAAAHLLLSDTAIKGFLFGRHKALGFLLFLLFFVRVAWALINAAKRPPSLSLAAKAGHIALYALLLAVPALALARQYGSGRSFDWFGISVFSGFEGNEIDWMVNIGNSFHSWAGWLLAALIAGHIIMVFLHKKASDQVDVLPRMWR
ncbi:cytochrome b [Halioxenophilus aromaticivorans]|uniref:Cytochrome b561 bacterial/Ni-hydrogenase domain-containing protein n=1 Tax=Halioxenophilus aromaticivorans TaxID=1306992 RepID=A0AAV3U2V5_9ALTE